MYIEVHNANYGYATATYGDYVAIGNPVFLRYTGSTPDVYYTGSVDVFRYNKTTDQHDLINTLFVHGAGLETLLATELIDPLLHTEYGSYWSADLDIWIDREKYYSSIEDGTGVSLDMYAKTLVAGVPYYRVRFKTDYVELFASGSAVDIYDFTRKETIPGTDPYVGSLMNPHSYITESFGIGVGINSEWIAVGSPLVSSSCGMVYVYQNISTGSNNFSWSLFQTITSPNPMPEQQFGRSIKLNKQSGYYSSSMVVGCGLSSSNEAYYFEFISGSWISSYTFKPTTDIYPLTFGNYPPYAPTMSLNSGFGYDVSLFNNSVIIGAYADRLVYEYTGSSQFQQGAVYIFEKCHDVPLSKFRLALKTYGTPLTLRNNRMGFSVDMFDKYAVAGIPKIDSLIYYYDDKQKLINKFGFAGQEMRCDYQGYSGRDIVRMQADRLKFSYYDWIEYIDETGLLFRSYFKNPSCKYDGLQIYGHGDLFGDINVPKGFQVRYYKEPFYYSNVFIDEEANAMWVYKFTLPR